MVDKPAKVFARDDEWAALEKFVSSPSPHVRMGVVSGRRRQGKTYLLRALTEAVGGFYFTAQEGTSADLLRELGVHLACHTGAAAPYVLRDWDDALRIMYQAHPDGLIVLDEFPYLIQADRAMPSLVQRALDPHGWGQQGAGTRLLLCGSAMSVMGRLLTSTAPLRGRASLEMVIRPFDYRTSARFWEIDDFRLAVKLHAVVGGTPAYRHAFVAEDVPESPRDFDDWIVRTVLNPNVPLFREARYLLAEETDVREPALYHSVLAAIATGHTTRGGIADYVGRKSSDLAHALNVLEDAALIRREEDPLHARRSTFRVTEPLLVFYEAVMRRFWTPLEEGHARAVWQRSQATFLSQVVGPHFEGLCRDWAWHGLAEWTDIPGEVASTTVTDPARRAKIEIDVAVLSPAWPGERRKALALGEAKWSKVMGLRHLERLRRARDLISAQGRLDTTGTLLLCFSGAGFDDDLRQEARVDPRVVLVDLETLYR